MADKRKTKVPMREQDPEVRRRNFLEVPLGYSPEEAREEAARCLMCKKPKCVEGCPVEIDIPGFIALIKEGRFNEAARHIKQKNALPAICGRVCPQEEQCEAVCVVAKKGESVAIGNLERFAADYEAAHPDGVCPEIGPKRDLKVAVVGSGPAGLTVAADLALKGYQVTIFEALHKAGGVLVYGIPEFRLPKAIVQRELDYLASLGVEIRCNVVVGASISIDDLFEEGYKAVFIGVGAGLPMFLNIPGENLNGVYSANEYLTRANLMRAFEFPNSDTPIAHGRRVAVFGGGNVAMDAARTALRLGADEVFLFYRRAREQMPARQEEIHHAEQEGLNFQFLTSPVELLGDGKGNLRAVRCQRMELGEPDASGRRRPVPVEGSEFDTEIDIAVVAIGNGSNPLLTQATADLETNKWGNIVADPKTGRTTKRGVFAGGDIVTGAATVILAAGAGRKAANAIDEYLNWVTW
ncbi:MAG: NADPH-dependent glutamate synthase [Acidobacteriota bacterium]|nr:NADPH-dependent glutamate synthase [Acidobacteriota bacterium]MDQ7087343.1 NADPH-dependent glutamate synthase [Acidobacteriota bacterium]